MNSRRSPVSRGSSSPPRTSVIPISIVNQLCNTILQINQRRISDSLQYYQVQRFASTPRPLLEQEKPAAKPAPQKTSAAATQHTHNPKHPQVAPESIRLSKPQRPLQLASEATRQSAGNHPPASVEDRCIHTIPTKDPRHPAPRPRIKKDGPPAGGPPHAPSRNRTENLLIKSQLL